MNFEFFPQVVVRTPIFPVNGDIDEFILREAIYIAAPEYMDYRSKFETVPQLKTQITNYKFATRAKTRCTPYGLFAGLSIIEWNSQCETKVVLDCNFDSTIVRRTSIDMTVQGQLAKFASELPEMVNGCLF